MKNFRQNHALILFASLMLSFSKACGKQPKDSKAKAISVEPIESDADKDSSVVPAAEAHEQQTAEQTEQKPIVEAAVEESLDSENVASNVGATEQADTQAVNDSTELATDDSIGKETVVLADGREVEVDTVSECSKVPAELGSMVLNGALKILIEGTEELDNTVGDLGDQVLTSSSVIPCAGEIIN